MYTQLHYIWFDLIWFILSLYKGTTSVLSTDLPVVPVLYIFNLDINNLYNR